VKLTRLKKMNGYVLTKHNKIVVAVDIDEVLGQFLNSLIQFHNDTYGTHLKLSDFHSYEFHEIWGGTPEEGTHFLFILPTAKTRQVLSLSLCEDTTVFYK